MARCPPRLSLVDCSESRTAVSQFISVLWLSGTRLKAAGHASNHGLVFFRPQLAEKNPLGQVGQVLRILSSQRKVF